ncbi:MAG: low affinity iron permease family protein [bacterium]|nr:low affinity iron permease family protein [bacterium]
MEHFFRKFASRTSAVVGSPYAFLVAVIVVIIWAFTGDYFGYSDTWQLVINTGTTIVTFLMVFLIQNTQNRDARGVHLKLDELIKNVKGARNMLMDIDYISDAEMAELEDEFKKLSDKYHVALEERQKKRT